MYKDKTYLLTLCILYDTVEMATLDSQEKALLCLPEQEYYLLNTFMDETFCNIICLKHCYQIELHVTFLTCDMLH